jgi:hypothetical protein
VAVAAAVCGAAGLSVVAPGAMAAADEPAGTTVVGELVQAWAESDAHAHGRTAEGAPEPVSWVETAAGDAVPVDSADVADVPAGSTVSLTVGAADDDAAPVLGTEILGTPPVVAALPGPVTNEVTVAMVVPAGTPAGPRASLQEIVDLVDGPVARFWAEETDGAVSVGVTAAHDWIPTIAGCAQPGVLWSEVAAAVRFVPGPGRHLLLYIPPTTPGCAYALAEVGASATSGGRLYVTEASASAIAHELGHNFGLAHSSGAQCDGAVDGGRCRTVGYRDYYDVMGVSWAQTGSLNVVQAAALGVLPAAQVQQLSVFGGAATVTLAPVSGRSGVRALRLTDALGVDHWLEYRPAAGRDAWLGTEADQFALDSGVLLRRAGSFPDTSVLLDGTPSPAGRWDGDLQSALAVGTPVTVSGGQFTIELVGLTGDGAVLTVLPTPPAVAPDTRAPAPAEPSPGTVLPGAGAGSSPPAGPVEDPPAAQEATVALQAPDLARLRATAQPELAAASQPTGTGNGLLLAGLGTALAGGALLVARTLRRRIRR